MTSYRIVLVDDHTLFRQGVRKIIEEVVDCKVVEEVSDGLALVELLKKLTPDMIILDISMPNLRGIEATRDIKRIHPDLKILILTMRRTPRHVFQIIQKFLISV